MKSRIQGAKGGTAPPTIQSIVQETLRRDGIAGLYKGITAKIFQTVLNAALTVLLKDKSVLYVVYLLGMLKGKKEAKINN